MSGVLPEILPQEKLQDGNAVIGLMSNIGNVSGALLGGIIVATFNPGWGLLIDAMTFFIAGVLVWNLALPARGKVESSGIIHDLAVGWREFISRSWVVTMVVAFALINMVFESMLQVLGPLNYGDLKTGPRQWSLNLAGLTIGMMIGGFIVLKRKFKRPLAIAMVLVALSAAWDLVLALDYALPVAMAAAIFSGITLEFFMVTWNTSLQSHIPSQSLSRVSAYDALGSYGIAPIGIVLAGPLVAHFSVNSILFATGLITFLAAGLSLSVKSVRELANP
jgi:predicted MFS family arabinose efflux permease